MTTTFELVDSDWGRVIDKAIAAYPSEVRLISPFIKLRIVKRLLEGKKPQLLRVITRFNLADFCSGVSDTTALRFLLEKGAEIRGVKKLHAKLYLFGRRVIATSANLTHAALTQNHEFGFVAEDREVFNRCQEYFEKLWKQAGSSLTVAILDKWDEQLKAVQATGSRPSLRNGLGDNGMDVGIASEPPDFSPLAQESQQAFVKFFGTGDGREDRNTGVFEEVKGSGCHWACTYPKNKRPRGGQDGAIMFMGRLVHSPDDTLIYGRAIAVHHEPCRDDVSTADLKLRPWKKDWPHYIRVHQAKFIAGTLKNGVSLNQLMDDLGSNTFASTQRNENAGNGNTNPRRAFRQQAAVELSTAGFALLNARLEEAFTVNGKVSDTELETLDWPSIDMVQSDGLSGAGRKLLRVLVEKLGAGSVDTENPETFPSYKDTLIAIGVQPWSGVRLGPQFKRHGGTDLNQWLKGKGLPAITGMVVKRSSSRPGDDYFHSNGHNVDDVEWWLGEIRKASKLNWQEYL